MNLAGLAGLAGLSFLALLAAPLLWRALTRLTFLLSYPYPHDGLEGTLLHEARLLHAGMPLYQPLERFRFVSAPYPPLHPLILGMADRIAGPHIFWGGRLVSLAASLAVALVIVLIARRVGGSWIAGLIGTALFLSAPPVLLWATRIKPDLLALLWTALGLYLAIRATTDNRRPTTDDQQNYSQADEQASRQEYRQRDRASIARSLRWSVVGAAICFALAFFTKQTTVAAPLAVGLALLITDIRAFYRGERAGFAGKLPLRWRTLAFGLTYLALALGIWALLDAITDGQYTAHVWGLHRSEWWSFYLLRKFVGLLAPYSPAMLLGLGLLIAGLRGERPLVPACYVLVVPITLLGAGETGANHNHLLETLLALALATGMSAGWAADVLAQRQLATLTERRSYTSTKTATEPALVTFQNPLRSLRWEYFAAVLALALAAGQLALAFQPQRWYLGELTPSDPPERYLVFMRATQGEILADDVGLLFAAGRPLRYDDPSTMGPAASSGVWDQSGLLQEIGERRFSAIIIPVDVEKEARDASGRWTPEMLAAIRTHYQLAFRDTLFTYIPR